MLTAIRITNYKCFSDSGWVEFRSGVNFIVGRNNAGKSTLMSQLPIAGIGPKPFRGLSQLKGLAIHPDSAVTARIAIPGDELERILLSTSLAFFWPRDEAHGGPAACAKWTEQAQNFFSEETLQVELQANSNSGEFIFTIAITTSNKNLLSRGAYVRFAPNTVKGKVELDIENDNFRHEDINRYCTKYVSQLIYVFRAERIHIGSSQVADNLVLNPDASNLAQVLNKFKGHRTSFDRYVGLVREIIPEITDIILAPSSQTGQVEVRISTSPPEAERNDLDIPLSECGTGLSQILAILYVVVTAEFPRLIAIDEPGSFLHPGAAKQLIRILNRYPQHQYVLATHSLDLIETADPSTITMLHWTPAGSTATSIDRRKIDEVKGALSELGIRFSDVMGPDGIVWVEGETEELCFPLLLRAAGKALDRGVVFQALKMPDNLRGRHKKTWFELFDQSGAGKSILPEAFAYSLDREKLSETEIADIVRTSKDRAKFLPRRCYENFLLQPQAIQHVLEEEGFPISVGKITSWLKSNGANLTHVPKETWNNDLADMTWLREVDGGKLMSALFSELTEQRLEYRKKQHGYRLTDWLVSNNKSSLTELLAYISDLCGSAIGKT